LLARGPVGQIEKFIRRVGLFHVKGLALKKRARQLVEYPAGEVLVTMEALTRLAGVGRKVPLLEKTRGLKPLVDTESVCRHATVIADREKKVIV
jgi:endonuclease III